MLFALAVFSVACGNDAPVNEDIAQPVETPPPTPELTPEPTPTLCQHDWKEADCENPKLCLDCGETEGVALEHDWKEANFHEGEICLLCNFHNFSDEGRRLRSGVSIHNLDINNPPIQVLPLSNNYTTVTGNGSAQTIGLVALGNYIVSNQFNGIDAMDGYEFVTFRFGLHFSDSAAHRDGARWIIGSFDFYNYDPMEELVPYDDMEDSNIDGFKVWRTVNYFGEDFEVYLHANTINQGWHRWHGGHDLVIDEEYTYLMPIGYDGIVVYITNGRHIDRFLSGEAKTVGDFFDNDTLFLQLDLEIISNVAGFLIPVNYFCTHCDWEHETTDFGYYGNTCVDCGTGRIRSVLGLI
jgi:hypothetical protein